MSELELSLQLNEIEILKVIDHPSIVKIYDKFEDNSKLYIVMEFISGRDLY